MLTKVPTLALSKSGSGFVCDEYLRVEGHTFLSACPRRVTHQAPRLFDCKIKTGDTHRMPPVKNPCIMTSYGGIIRIRFRFHQRRTPQGRSWMTSSQPADTSSPAFILLAILYTCFYKNTIVFLKKFKIFSLEGLYNYMSMEICPDMERQKDSPKRVPL